MAKSFQERRKEKQKASFIGRSEHLTIFIDNLDSNDPINIFNIYGQGGVGKSYLVNQYKSIAEDNQCLTCYSDESIKSVLQWMESTSDQFKKKNIELTEFDKRYRTYLQEIKKLETDPEKPKGTLGGIVKAASRGLIKEGKKLVPGGEILGGFIDEESLSTTLGEWAEFARKKIANKDEVELVLEPEKVLTPLFWKGLSKYADNKKFVCLFIDTYEEVDTVLEKWLLELLDGKHGEIPENILLIIAGREELNANTWSDLKNMIQKIQLEPFTEKEAIEFLRSKDVKDPNVQNDIMELSGRLPVLMALLTDAVDKRAGAIEDPAHTAVERFLKWVQDKNQRKIALDAALPRRLNQDIIESLLEDKSKAKDHFEWLTSQPFVLAKDDHWVYHSVVRDQMLRFVRIRSNKEWTAVQECLGKYYSQLQNELEVAPTQELLHKKWMEYELEKDYHLLCFKTDKYTPVIVQQFVRFMYEQGIYKAGIFGETLLLAAKDIDNEMNRNWGQRINAAIKEFSEENKHTLILQLIKDIQALDWVKNDDHKSYLLLIEGFTHPNIDDAIKALHTAIAIRPNYTEAYFNVGVLYARKEDHKNAVMAYEKVIELNPYDRDAWYNLGSSYYYLNDFDKAIETLQQALVVNPDDHSAYNNLGLSWYNKEAYDKAIGCFEQALDLKPDYYLAHYNMGLAYSKKQEHATALQYFQNTIRYKPDYYFALFKIGQSYFALKQYDDSIEAYRQAIVIKPDYADSHYNMAMVYATKKEYDKAIESYNMAVALKPDDYEALFRIGQIYGDKVMFGKAVEFYEKAVAIKPDYQIAVANLGWAYVSNGNYDKSIEMLARAVELDPRDYTSFNNMGRAHFYKKNYEDAIKSYQQSIAVYPDYALAYSNLGNTYLAIPDYDLALPALERSIDLNPDDVNTLCDLAYIYSAKDREAESNELYKKAIALDPGYDLPHINLGYTYLKNGQVDEAEPLLLKAIQLNNYDLGFMNAGHIYLIRGDEEKAIHHYEEGFGLTASEDGYLEGMQSDYEILKQYNIAEDYYKGLIEKIKRPVKTPTAH